MPRLRPANLRIVDLKRSWNQQPGREEVAYRPECFSCEHYKYNVFGGVVTVDELGKESEPEKSWKCELLDNGRRCKLDKEEDKGQEKEAVEPRLPVHKASSGQVQHKPSSQDISSEQRLDQKDSSESESSMSNLPRVEAPKLRSRAPRREESEDSNLDL